MPTRHADATLLSAKILGVLLCYLLGAGKLFADNSVSCLNPVEADLTSNRYVVVEPYDRRYDEDFYRVRVPGPGLVAGRLFLDTGATHLRPKFHRFFLTTACTPSPAGVTRLSDLNQELSVVAETAGSSEFVLVVTGAGNSQSIGEKYRLILSFLPRPQVVDINAVSFGAADFQNGWPDLPTVHERPMRIQVAPSEPIPSGTLGLDLPAAGTGIMIATIQPSSFVRASISPRSGGTWSMTVGKGHPPLNAIPVDGSLNSDLELQVSLYSQSTIPQDLRLSIEWIPDCNLRRSVEVASLGCLSADLGERLPETRRLKVTYGGRIVAGFEIASSGDGPVRISTSNSDFDPLIRIRSLAGGERLGVDQDDGPDIESMWLETLPSGRYAVEVVDQSGYGSGWTTISVEQDPDFLDDPGEYPDPADDLAPSKCLSGGLPPLVPGEAVSAGFESRTDVDAYSLSVPDQPGSIALWTVGAIAHGELRDPIHSDLPPLVTTMEMGYPFGIERTIDGTAGVLCVVLSSAEHAVEPYVLGYAFRPLQVDSGAVSQASATDTCHVETRSYLDTSIRETASCHTAWRALVGRKMAMSRFTGVRESFRARLENPGQASPLFAQARMILASGQVAYDLGLASSLEIALLKGVYTPPKVILDVLEAEDEVGEAVLQITSCLADAIVAVTEAYATGNPSSIIGFGCVAGILLDAVEDLWAAGELDALTRNFEAEIVMWRFLDEYYALGGMGALAARYETSGPDIVRAIADSQGLLGEGIFPLSSDRAGLFVALYDYVSDYIVEQVEPVVANREAAAGD